MICTCAAAGAKRARPHSGKSHNPVIGSTQERVFTVNITILYPHKRKTKSSTYGIAQMVLDRLLSGGTLHEFYLPQDMPHVCAGCYACMNGREDKCGGHEYMQKLIAAIDDSELIIFCAPTYVYHIPGQVKTLLDHFAYRWLVHRPDLSLMCKQALIITTAAGGGMKSTVRDLRDSMNYWGVGRTHVITQAVWGYDWSSMPENFMHKIQQKVEKTVSAIRKNAGNVTPCAKVKGLFYMYRLFHKKRKMNPVDDEYWYRKRLCDAGNPGKEDDNGNHKRISRGNIRPPVRTGRRNASSHDGGVHTLLQRQNRRRNL